MEFTQGTFLVVNVIVFPFLNLNENSSWSHLYIFIYNDVKTKILIILAVVISSMLRVVRGVCLLSVYV